MNGLQRARHAVALAAGWPWCDEHLAPRFRPGGCNHLHPVLVKHHYWCEHPDRDCICDPYEVRP